MIGGSFGAVLRLAQRGDEDAFDALWRDLNPVLVRYLRALVVGSRSDPEALATDTWVEAVRRLPGFRGDEIAWRSWVLRRARRLARADARRLRWAAADQAPGPAVAHPAAAARVTPLRPRATLQDVVTSFAVDLLATLPRLDREVLVLRAGAGLPADEVARVVNRGRQSVRSLGHRAAVAVARSPLWGPAAPAAPAALHANVEAVLAGEPVGESAAVEVQRLADVAGALAAPATPAELIGSAPARAAFDRFVAGGAPRRALVPVRWGTQFASGVAAAAVALGGTAAVAYAGALPGPLQEVAHDLFRAPAPEPTSDAQETRGAATSSAAPTSATGTGSTDRSPSGTGTAAQRSGSPGRDGRPARPTSTAPGLGVGSATLDPGPPTDDSGLATVPSDAPVPTDVASDVPSATPSDPVTADTSSTAPSPTPTTAHGRPSTKPPHDPHSSPGGPQASTTRGRPAVGRP